MVPLPPYYFEVVLVNWVVSLVIVVINGWGVIQVLFVSFTTFPHIRCCLSAIPSDLMKSTAVDESLSSMNQQFCSRENQLLQIVISVYWPPSTPIDVFMNNMLDIIAQFQNAPTCIVGDFNEDVSIASILTVVQCLDYKAFSK